MTLGFAGEKKNIILRPFLERINPYATIFMSFRRYKTLF